MNKSMSNMDTAVDPMSEEEHLRAIWKELEVGRKGYLSLNELAAVCAHIGMEDMNKEVMYEIL
jgi:Ca2+-binding EF-hand superfamily protein